MSMKNSSDTIGNRTCDLPPVPSLFHLLLCCRQLNLPFKKLWLLYAPTVVKLQKLNFVHTHSFVWLSQPTVKPSPNHYRSTLSNGDAVCLLRGTVHSVNAVAPYLRRLDAGLSQRRPGFDPGTFQAKSVVNKVAL